MKGENLQHRTKLFALRIVKLAQSLESVPLGKFIGHQIFRSGTSVAANYRAACRAKSVRDFVAKLGIVIEETDETCFWLELLIESKIVSPVKVTDLYTEAQEITAIMVSSKNSTIKNNRNKKS